MSRALIGSTGFVGSSLLRQTHFSHLFHSTNIADIDGRVFDFTVCCAAPAQKWLANQDPQRDSQNIEKLIGHLSQIESRKFVLISTVDVFGNPVGVDEESSIDTTELSAYGRHRYQLETFARNKFEHCLIVRLPGLVGPGLRKNIIFDFQNSNQLEKIDSEAVFQFYPMVNLWFDIQTALKAELELVHLTSEPVSVACVAQDGFGMEFDNRLSQKSVTYDMKTRYSSIFGGSKNYTYSARESLQAIRAYAQSEPKQLNN